MEVKCVYSVPCAMHGLCALYVNKKPTNVLLKMVMSKTTFPDQQEQVVLEAQAANGENGHIKSAYTKSKVNKTSLPQPRTSEW